MILQLNDSNKSTESSSMEDEEEYLDEEYDEESYSRGRSRSRSIHANDSLHPGENLLPASITFEPPDQSLLQVHIPDTDVRSGPLKEREVLALQKVL